jgi:biotin transport system substrate-specific component
MRTSILTHTILIDRLWQSHKAIRSLILVLSGSFVIWISAKIQIPFYPVPITMQTLVVLALGICYGWKLGLATVLFYLLQGSLGLPVFAGSPEKGIGLLYMMGPTGGYLFGFIISVWVMGFLAERGWDRNSFKIALTMMLGHIIIYFFGLLWLGSLTGWDKTILSLGIMPFLLGDLLKVLLGSVTIPLIWKKIQKK